MRSFIFKIWYLIMDYLELVKFLTLSLFPVIIVWVIYYIYTNK